MSDILGPEGMSCHHKLSLTVALEVKKLLPEYDKEMVFTRSESALLSKRRIIIS
jgi:hypothetical protein